MSGPVLLYYLHMSHCCMNESNDDDDCHNAADAAGVLLQLRELTVTYSKRFKDPFVLDPPTWFRSFIYCELLLQFPFFFVASYAFWKGSIECYVVLLACC